MQTVPNNQETGARTLYTHTAEELLYKATRARTGTAMAFWYRAHRCNFRVSIHTESDLPAHRSHQAALHSSGPAGCVWVVLLDGARCCYEILQRTTAATAAAVPRNTAAHCCCQRTAAVTVAAVAHTCPNHLPEEVTQTDWLLSPPPPPPPPLAAAAVAAIAGGCRCCC